MRKGILILDRIDLLNKLSLCFARDSIKKETFLIYLEMLKEIPDAQLEYAVNWCIVNCRYFPTIAEIRKAAQTFKDNSNPNLKTWAEVAQEIESALKHNGQYTPPTWSTPLIAQLMKNRWIDFLEMQAVDKGTMMAQTRATYEGLLARERSKQEDREILATLPLSTQKTLAENRKVIAGLTDQILLDTGN